MTRQKRESRPRIELTPGQRKYFETGIEPDGETYLWVACDDALVREAWLAWHVEITADFVAENPGKRPFAEKLFGC